MGTPRTASSVLAVAGRLAAACGLVSLPLAAVSSRQEAPARGDQLALMSDLTQQFRTLEAHLEKGDLAAFAAATAGRKDLGHQLAGLRPKLDPALVEDFEQHGRRLSELAEDAGAWAARGRLAETRQAFEELRATCVSCHLRYRADNETRGDYPARANTVTGTIELRDAGGELRADRSWVLVFLESERAPAAGIPPRHPPSISQVDRQFRPRVLPVTVGTTVEFPNDDTIFHNVFSVSKTLPFDLGVYEPGRSESREMLRTGLVKVYCNIHPEMAASIVVLANPWFGMSDRAGTFVITGVPDGEYVLRAWNDMGAELRRPLALTGGKVARETLALAETRRAVAHKNKFGKDYPAKYK